MLGKEKLAAIAERILALSEADQTEVLVISGDEQLTRFAVNTIHQNVSETDAVVRVRAVFGQREGVASGNDLSEEGLRTVVESAETIARFQHANPEFQSLPAPRPVQQVEAYVAETAHCTPQQRAEGVAKICKMCLENGLEAAGAFSTAVQEIMVANSLGISAYHCGTMAHIVNVAMGPNSSGYATDCAADVSELDPQTIGQIALEKALRSRDPVDFEPGEYTVILEENAVADMIFTLAYLGFGALALQEGRSFMCERLGEQITGRNITIWDDGLDRRGVPMPFDFEGVPKQKVMLIEDGVAKNVVYDSFTAKREEGQESTGHGLPAPNTMGPFTTNLFMAPGEYGKEEMLASTERGIWVTRFHYTNPLHPIKTTWTGMTRDGTFLIEDGKITRPLKNLRFTESILESLGRATMLGRELKLVKMGWGNFVTCAPAAKIEDYRFTGTTQF